LTGKVTARETESMRVIVLILFSLGLNSRAETYDPANLVALPTKPEETKPIQVKSFDKARSKKFHVGLGFGHQLVTGKSKFHSYHRTDTLGADQSGYAEFKYKPTYMFQIDARILPIRSWGFIAGLNYEGEREFDGGKITIDGNTYTYYGWDGGPKIQFATLFASAAYRWTQFYIPFGLNYSFAHYKAPSGYSGATTTSGGPGAQLGMGFMSTDHIAVEFYGWLTSAWLKESAGGNSVNFGYGTFPTLLLLVKYLF
jgi:hypothetical protein